MQGKKQLLSFLSGFVTEERRKRFAEVLANRTRHITIGLENIYQPHNASAVLRSCDCFGVQDVHIIENENTYSVNPDVALGSYKWLTLHKYNMLENRFDAAQNTSQCIQELKKKDYTIAVTSSHQIDTGTKARKQYSIENIPLKDKVALFFGTEMHGVSSELEKSADCCVSIEMYGFTESFNISVAAAICMYTLSKRLRQEKIDWQLKDDEKEELLLQWCRNTIPKADLLEKQFISENQKPAK